MTDLTHTKDRKREDFHALIVTGGDVDFTYRPEKGGLVVAVDGGLEAVRAMGLKPHVIIGDFDTIAPEILREYEGEERIEMIRLSPMKDDTDTQAAVNLVLDRGYRKIDVLGATGSRFDHSFANMFLLKMARKRGAEMTYYTPLSKIYLISGTKEYRKEDFFGKYISFLQFDGSAKDVTLRGFAYEVEHFDFDTAKGYRLGVSNEPKEETAIVRIGKGFLLVVESKEDKNL